MRGWILLALALVSGCSAAEPVVAPSSSASRPSAPAVPKVNEHERLAATMLTDSEGTALGFTYQSEPTPFIESQNQKFALVAACPGRLPSDSRIVRAEQATWRNDDYNLEELTAQYSGIPAADAVGEVARTKGCRANVGSGGRIDEISLPSVPGADAAKAFCTISEYGTDRCVVVVARGEFAAAGELRYYGIDGPANREATTALLRRVAIALGQGLGHVA
ncbi:hypothetical protein [Amycolatopsis deserti]|uniref:hypothetical protein n=1 Tax=Amycolatopsis deserti TaxID=185696 RepID=UPI00174E6B9E|nr:hypothetical protein [Amycolatopsis deserti]